MCVLKFRIEHCACLCISASLNIGKFMFLWVSAHWLSLVNWFLYGKCPTILNTLFHTLLAEIVLFMQVFIYLSSVRYYWQWPILINCVMCYYLCVLRWLMRTNFSSKLPVADRTREVWGRKLCWWCLSSGFQLCTFLLGFADSFCFVQLPFLWGLATLFDPVQSVPTTLLVCWSL